MPETQSFHALLSRVRAGDQAAAAELVRVYEPQIRRVVRIRLRDPRMRQLVDSTDICQSVLGNFFVRVASGQYELDTPEQLLRLLGTMARNKVTDWARRMCSDRRGEGRGVSLSQVAADSSAMATSNPGPPDVAAGKDLLHQVRLRLSQDERYLADQRSIGREWQDIALELATPPQTLRMRLSRALDRIARELSL